LVQHEADLAADRLSTFVSGPNRADAVFCLNWVYTIRALRALNFEDKKISRDVAFISFDDFELAELIPPGMTVVRQPSSELGRPAKITLFERIEEAEKQPPH
jgi:LacI family transcriptional regulator